jgi:uncharacterized membrane-anchored protein YhcB (DUF1043 family)
MIDLFIAFMIGFCIGIATGFKNKEWEEQQKMYEARLQDQANTIEYYKRLTKKVVNENTALRRAI